MKHGKRAAALRLAALLPVAAAAAALLLSQKELSDRLTREEELRAQITVTEQNAARFRERMELADTDWGVRAIAAAELGLVGPEDLILAQTEESEIQQK